MFQQRRIIKGQLCFWVSNLKKAKKEETLKWFSKIVFKIPYARNYNPQLEYVEDDFFVFKDTFLENSD